MNIQQYYLEREQAEQENASQPNAETDSVHETEHQQSTIIPVVQEQASVGKEEIETAKVWIQKKVTEVEKNVDIPLLQEGYDVERIPINQYVDTYPQVREDGNTIIIPVVREVLVVEKRLELVEEVHVVKRKTTVDHRETFTLKKEEVNVERKPANNNNL
jgi:uncharacterized protein (TIGR02271 family)